MRFQSQQNENILNPSILRYSKYRDLLARARSLIEKALNGIRGLRFYYRFHKKNSALVAKFCEVVKELENALPLGDNHQAIEHIKYYCEKFGEILTQIAGNKPPCLYRKQLKHLQVIAYELFKNLHVSGLSRVFYEELKINLAPLDCDACREYSSSGNLRENLLYICWQISNLGKNPLFFYGYPDLFLSEIRSALDNYCTLCIRASNVTEGNASNLQAVLPQLAQTRRQLAALLFHAWRAQFRLGQFLQDFDGFDLWKLNDMKQRDVSASDYSNNEQNIRNIYQEEARRIQNFWGQQIKNIFTQICQSHRGASNVPWRDIIAGLQSICSEVFDENHEFFNISGQKENDIEKDLALFLDFVKSLFD